VSIDGGRAHIEGAGLDADLAGVDLRATILKDVKGSFDAPPGALTQAGGAANGKALFASNGCVSCHTYKPAGSKATVGPDLDKLATYAKQAKKPLAPFVQESIVSPDAYVQPGYPPHVMPSFASLSKAQVDALVKFLTKGS